jgi:predicted transcriptional regulator
MAKKLMTIDDNLMERIKIAAAKRKCTHQQLIVDAVEEFLDVTINQAPVEQLKTEESF